MVAEEKNETATLRTGYPSATAEDEQQPRCPVDGGYFTDDGCERCGLDPETARDAATGPGRYALLATYADGNPQTWARFDDLAVALDVEARLERKFPRSGGAPAFGVLDERDGERWLTEEDLA